VSKKRLGQTPSQTVGPFFHFGLPYEGDSNLIVGDAQGQRIVVEGKVTDGAGEPVPDVMIEIWQANAAGKYDHPEDTQEKPVDEGFHGFGRCATDNNGIFRFQTVKPGAVPGPGNTLQAPHLVTFVFGRGMLKQLLTRIYFEDEAHNANDPVLALVPDERRGTLIARKISPSTYALNIVLQGAGETVFFDY
jgi:protocatechuate 3,4-dioxygenase alpha subunit